jgi:hypothetical protein
MIIHYLCALILVQDVMVVIVGGQSCCLMILLVCAHAQSGHSLNKTVT